MKKDKNLKNRVKCAIRSFQIGCQKEFSIQSDVLEQRRTFQSLYFQIFMNLARCGKRNIIKSSGRWQLAKKYRTAAIMKIIVGQFYGLTCSIYGTYVHFGRLILLPVNKQLKYYVSNDS